MADIVPVPLASLFAEDDASHRLQTLHHALEDILLIATLAGICGADSWTEIEILSHQKQARLATFPGLPHGIPSHDTFGRVFDLLDPAQLEARLTVWAVAGRDTARRGRGRGWQGGPGLVQARPRRVLPALGCRLDERSADPPGPRRSTGPDRIVRGGQEGQVCRLPPVRELVGVPAGTLVRRGAWQACSNQVRQSDKVVV